MNAAIVGAQWVLLFVSWLLFTASVKVEECIAGAAAASIAVFAFEVSKRAEPMRFNPPVRALIEAWRIPGLLLQGTWVLIREVVRRLAGKKSESAFQQTPFRAAGSDSRSAAQRALAILFGTLPPNFLIIGIDRKSKLMLFHQVRKDPAPAIVRNVESA